MLTFPSTHVTRHKRLKPSFFFDRAGRPRKRVMAALSTSDGEPFPRAWLPHSVPIPELETIGKTRTKLAASAHPWMPWMENGKPVVLFALEIDAARFRRTLADALRALHS